MKREFGRVNRSHLGSRHLALEPGGVRYSAAKGTAPGRSPCQACMAARNVARVVRWVVVAATLTWGGATSSRIFVVIVARCIR